MFDLPCPGDPDLEVWRDQRWPDPAADVGFKLLDLDWKPSLTGWGGVADRLIRLLDSKKVAVRDAALARLFVLDRAHLLRKSERARVGRAYWAIASEISSSRTGRWEQNFLEFALVWPHPIQEDAGEWLKERLLGHKLGAIHALSPTDPWLSRVMLFSDPGGVLPDRERLIWTEAERVQLCRILRDWWDAHDSKQAVDYVTDKHSFSFDRDAFGRFMIDMWDFVREVLLVQPKRRGRVAPLVHSLIKDIERAGLPVGCVMPAVLRIDQSQHGLVASVIRKELTSGRADFRVSALRRLVFWADAHRVRPSKNPLPKPPTDLIRELGAAIAMRHRCELQLLLNGASAILQRQLDLADRQFVESLLIGLDYLLTEAQYRDRMGDADSISYDDVPSVRVQCVRIAHQLSEMRKNNDPRVRRWLEAAERDPLPEVRASAAGSGGWL